MADSTAGSTDSQRLCTALRVQPAAWRSASCFSAQLSHELVERHVAMQPSVASCFSQPSPGDGDGDGWNLQPLCRLHGRPWAEALHASTRRWYRVSWSRSQNQSPTIGTHAWPCTSALDDTPCARHDGWKMPPRLLGERRVVDHLRRRVSHRLTVARDVRGDQRVLGGAGRLLRHALLCEDLVGVVLVLEDEERRLDVPVERVDQRAPRPDRGVVGEALRREEPFRCFV